MRVFKLVFFIGVIFWSSEVISQDELSEIVVRCKYKTGEAISDKVFSLYQGRDSITSATTDENGEFILELELAFSTEYQLIDETSNQKFTKPISFETTYLPQTYVLEILEESPTLRKFSQAPIAYYQANAVKINKEFEVEVIVGLIEAHPEICIQFSQTIIRSESQKTADKRKANFLKFLEENGVDMSCIRFEEEPRFLKAFLEDQRSRIEGAIYSLDSKCPK